MFRSVLVANRGEIARRVFATARRLNIETVAVFSEADRNAAHVRDADRSVLIGPAAARDSYLKGDRVIAAAQASGAEAIHPGYGFLSENAAFAEAVMAAGLVWIGPSPSAIRAMGLKDAAKDLMQKSGVPVTPGYLGEDQSTARLKAEAERIGFPVLIKAVAGGGGKGMRLVETSDDFESGLGACQREAAASFGDDRVLLETYVTRPRHIEVQVFGDSHGNIVHLFERDCSLQRRHQKVIEEAPAPGMDAATRAAVCEAAVLAAKAVNYEGAGTVEFIADASEGLKADRIWFMEMNTRLQVEHPVTEMITGQDLVEWQFRVAAGQPLPLAQDQISLDGHAVEARLYAENPATGFLPSIGRLAHFNPPDDVRVDGGVGEGDHISPFYDPMIAKLAAHAPTRQQAIADLARACARVEAWPVKTNAAFLMRCLETPDFATGAVDTGLIGRQMEPLTAAAEPSVEAVATAGWAYRDRIESREPAPTPWLALKGFQPNTPDMTTTAVFLGAKRYDAGMPAVPGRRHRLIGADEVVVFENGEAFRFSREPDINASGVGAGDGRIRSPMPGKITQLEVSVGQRVSEGQVLLAVEAMKMEHSLTAPRDGVVVEILAGQGQQVTEGAVLVRLEMDTEKAP